MLRAVCIVATAVGLAFGACDDGGVAYEVVVRFNASVEQTDLEEAEALLRTFDNGLDFRVQESFPPVGRAALETDEAGLCATIVSELDAESYVDDATCEEQ